jgi:hypothetical protein
VATGWHRDTSDLDAELLVGLASAWRRRAERRLVTTSEQCSHGPTRFPVVHPKPNAEEDS